MPEIHDQALQLATQLNQELQSPDSLGSWRDLANLNMPGLEFVGHWGTGELVPGDIVVGLDHSRVTANPVLVVGRVSENIAEYALCVPIKVNAVISPKDESPESLGVELGKNRLFGGFQVFRFKKSMQLSQEADRGHVTE